MIFHYMLVITSSHFLFTLSITKLFSFSAVRLLDKQRPTLFTAQILYQCDINLLLFSYCAIPTYTRTLSRSKWSWNSPLYFAQSPIRPQLVKYIS